MASSLTKFTEIAKRNIYPVLASEYEAEPVVYPLICEVVTDLEDVIYGQKGTSLTGMERPTLRSDGEPIQQGQVGEGYTWQIGLRLMSRMIRLPERHVEMLAAKGNLDRELLGQSRGWGTAFAQECDDIVAHVFQKGTLTAGFGNYRGRPFNQTFKGEDDPYPGKIYDNKPLFATDHPQKYHSGSGLSNFNASRALTYDNLQSSWTQMTSTSAYDDRNERVVIRPTHVVVPPSLNFTAKNILGSVGAPGVGNNDTNVIRGELEPLVWRALSDDTDAWWLVQAGKGIRVLDSGIPRLSTWFDMETREYCAAFEKRFGVGCTNWRFVQANNKAAS